MRPSLVALLGLGLVGVASSSALLTSAVLHPGHPSTPISPHASKPAPVIAYSERALSTPKVLNMDEAAIPKWTVNVDVTNKTRAVNDLLWGVFFEEINHAGVAGLYAEMINNYNFQTEDYQPWNAKKHKVGQAHRISMALDESFPVSNKVYRSLRATLKAVSPQERLDEMAEARKALGMKEPKPRTSPRHHFATQSFHDLHMSEEERLKLQADEEELQFGPQSSVGFYNPGYWGMKLVDQGVYSFSTYVRSDTIKGFNVQLLGGANYTNVYANQTVAIPSGQAGANGWTQVFANITASGVPNGVDTNGAFAIVFPDGDLASSGVQTINFIGVSLMPPNLYKGLPINADLANAVANLKPAFVRFPGGCYVEGDRLSDRFNWKKAIGDRVTRPGHWNLWGYWSDDGLGLYEYLSFIETLTNAQGGPTEAVWVLNNGISHSDTVPVEHIDYWVQDALDSMEFAMGDAKTTKYGAMRAAMGHPEPFVISIVAIGNEDCGHPWYNENYLAYYHALAQNYPKVRTIANCDMSPLPTDLWDYHVYTSSDWFFSNQFTFDGWNRSSPAKIFNSEYAVTTNPGKGNLWAALGEASWMTGLERNSDLVQLASYAPLFVNDHDRNWNPDAIVFNNAEWYGTPSYWTQTLFAQAQDGTKAGTQQIVSLDFKGMGTSATNVSISVSSAASASSMAKEILIFKIVNYNEYPVRLNFNLSNTANRVQEQADIQILTSVDTQDENSFDMPKLVYPFESIIQTAADYFGFTFDGYSINVMRVYLN